MNANGGTLLIGVSDDHEVIGLDLDYELNWKKNRDGLLLEFRGYIEKQIGTTNYNRYVNTEFKDVEGKDVCIVTVEKSLDPVFVKLNGKKIMFIRLDNRTEPVDVPEETNKYIEDNWK